MVGLWCGCCLPGVISLSNNPIISIGSIDLGVVLGLAVLLFMLLMAFCLGERGDSLLYMLVLAMMGTGVLSVVYGVIIVSDIFNGGARTYSLLWATQLITFTSLMLVGFLLVNMNEIGVTIYMIVAGILSYIPLAFDYTGSAPTTLIIIFIILGCLAWGGIYFNVRNR